MVEHDTLLAELRRVIQEQDKEARTRAVRALRYAKARKEGLVHWRFTIDSVPRKDLLVWATAQVRLYFVKV